MPDNLQVRILVDGSQLSAGMKEASATVEAASAQMNAAFSTVEAGAGKLEFSATEARHALHGLGEEMGVHVPRFVQSFVAHLGSVGPALAAAFTPIALVGLGEVFKDAIEKLSELTAKTLIFTEAEKKLYEEGIKGNAAILAADEEHKRLLGEIALLGLSAVEQAKLRAQWAQEDLKAGQASFDKTKEELAAERTKLELLRQQREEKIAALSAESPESGLAATGFLDKEITAAEEKIGKLNIELTVTRAQLNATGDSATIAGKRLEEAFHKANERIAEDAADSHDYTAKLAQADLAEFEKNQRSKALLAIDVQAAVQKAETATLAERAKENTEFDRNIVEEEKKLNEDVVRFNRQRLEQAVQDQNKANREMDRVVKEAQRPYVELGHAITSGMDQMIRGVLQGTQTVGQAFARLGTDMLVIMTEALAKIYLKHLAHWVAVNVLEKLHVTESIGTLIAGATAKKAVQTAANVSAVTSDAGVAGAAAWASVMSALPFPVNVATAPGVSAAAIASTLSNAALASAAGGWDVPGSISPGGALALLHPKEMVLPAELADRVRGGGSDTGGRDTHVHVHISAVDAHGVEDFFRRNQSAFEKSIRRAVRRSNQ